jgi:hypothetical protein
VRRKGGKIVALRGRTELEGWGGLERLALGAGEKEEKHPGLWGSSLPEQFAYVCHIFQQKYGSAFLIFFGWNSRPIDTLPASTIYRLRLVYELR